MIQCVSEKKTLTVNAHSERKQRPDNGAAANVSTPGSTLTSAPASLLMKVAGLSHSECVQDVPSPGRIFWNNGLESLMHELHFPPVPPSVSFLFLFLSLHKDTRLAELVCVRVQSLSSLCVFTQSRFQQGPGSFDADQHHPTSMCPIQQLHDFSPFQLFAHFLNLPCSTT